MWTGGNRFDNNQDHDWMIKIILCLLNWPLGHDFISPDYIVGPAYQRALWKSDQGALSQSSLPHG